MRTEYNYQVHYVQQTVERRINQFVFQKQHEKRFSTNPFYKLIEFLEVEIN